MNPRQRRHFRLRKKIKGTMDRPRLAVFQSLKHIGGQIVDDDQGKTLLGLSSNSKAMKAGMKHGGNIEAAKMVGEALAKQALAKGIKRVVFDRGGMAFHGRVKAFADAARAAGLEF
jgi:large subunit ribosomal protein L18